MSTVSTSFTGGMGFKFPLPPPSPGRPRTTSVISGRNMRGYSTSAASQSTVSVGSESRSVLQKNKRRGFILKDSDARNIGRMENVSQQAAIDILADSDDEYGQGAILAQAQEAKRQEEARRREAGKQQEVARRQEEMLRRQDEAKQQEEKKRAEKAFQAEQKRILKARQKQSVRAQVAMLAGLYVPPTAYTLTPTSPTTSTQSHTTSPTTSLSSPTFSSAISVSTAPTSISDSSPQHTFPAAPPTTPFEASRARRRSLGSVSTYSTPNLKKKKGKARSPERMRRSSLESIRSPPRLESKDGSVLSPTTPQQGERGENGNAGKSRWGLRRQSAKLVRPPSEPAPWTTRTVQGGGEFVSFFEF